MNQHIIYEWNKNEKNTCTSEGNYFWSAIGGASLMSLACNNTSYLWTKASFVIYHRLCNNFTCFLFQVQRPFYVYNRMLQQKKMEIYNQTKENLPTIERIPTKFRKFLELSVNFGVCTTLFRLNQKRNVFLPQCTHYISKSIGFW